MSEDELGSAKQSCIKSAFDVITGRGEWLNYGPGEFAEAVLEMMPAMDLKSAPESFGS